jgi:hypothetical protein
MDTRRLEELVVRANTRHADALSDEDYADLADLARCANAWAKVERSSNPMIERRNWPQGAKWYFRPGGRSTGSGDTAIAAVEAAQEVKL